MESIDRLMRGACPGYTMCDTLVALGNTTADGSVIFGKNSDRYPNEPHVIEFAPPRHHPPEATLRCTYITIPQAEYTHAVFLCRPFWTWGAEMGINEHGVAIGNEAIFSRIAAVRKPRLIGMDLLRLGLERSTSAHEALQTITDLLDRYGQGGNHAYRHRFYYHNSYLIADKQEAWVLETIDRVWVARRLPNGGTISNQLTIETEWDWSSETLTSFVTQRGIVKSGERLNVRKSLSDKLFTWGACARERSSRAEYLLALNEGNVTPALFMKILADHGDSDQPFQPKGLFNTTICAHGGWGPARRHIQTTCSFVAHLTESNPTIWVTATAAPCTSLFKPVWFAGGLPDLGPAPGPMFDDRSLWWSHELLHRKTLEDYASLIQVYRDDLTETQNSFLRLVSDRKQPDTGSVTNECFETARQKEHEWYQRIKSLKHRQGQSFLMRRAWRRFNREAGITP